MIDQILDFDTWVDLNIDCVKIELAESGADREMDFDLEMELEKRYERYEQEKISS